VGSQKPKSEQALNEKTVLFMQAKVVLKLAGCNTTHVGDQAMSEK